MALPCGCCHGRDVVPLLSAPDRDNRLITVHHCRSCCALTPDYPPNTDNIVERQTAYHAAYWRTDEDETYRRDRDAMQGVLDFHARHLPTSDAGLIYDLGAGRANLLSRLVGNGYRAFGCEPSAELVERARSIYGLDENILVATDIDMFLKSRPQDEQSVDVIFLWHVLEHLADAVATLMHCASFLSKTGVIIAQGPLLAPGWVYPEHNFLHSESNISWLASAAGLKVVLCEAQNSDRFVSFVFAKPDHPAPAAQTVFLPDPLEAAGSLYFTQSAALRRLAERQ